jgi:hypothetical protein
MPEKPMMKKKPQASSQKPVERRRLLCSSWILACGFWLLSLSGCASSDKKPSTRPSSMSDRQDAAMRDPFGYKPDITRDISGGDVGHYDRDGMKKDLNHVLNP